MQNTPYTASWEYTLFAQYQKAAQDELIYWGSIMPETSEKLKLAWNDLPTEEKARMMKVPFLNFKY